jgi:hypothetical protein
MRIKVELHPAVVKFIRRDCNERERDAFYEMLERLRQEPIKNSEFIYDPRLSRHALRFARFGMYMAIFQYDIAKQKIRVRICRKAQQALEGE